MSCRFARRLNTVVATSAITKDIRMGEVSRHPGVCDVTIVAGVITADVRRILTGRRHAVVAANAIAENIAVVEKCGRPGGCIVTVIALVAGGNMGWSLTRGLHAVMA